MAGGIGRGPADRGAERIRGRDDRAGNRLVGGIDHDAVDPGQLGLRLRPERPQERHRERDGDPAPLRRHVIVSSQ